MFFRGWVAMAFGTVATLWCHPAAADIMFWNVTTECHEGSNETVLRARCSDGMDCLGRSTQLYGCNGDCDRARLLGIDLVWRDVECDCFDYEIGNFSCEDATVMCGPWESCKCQVSAWTTLPLSCDELGYGYVCPEPDCEVDLERVGSCEGSCFLSCAYFLTDADKIASCPGTGGRLASVGCSTSPRSTGGATLATLVLLGLALAVSLMAARRMSRRPRDARPGR